MNLTMFYFVYGSGCCLPTITDLSSPAIDIESMGFCETKSIKAADFIIVYGFISRESAEELSLLIKSAQKNIPVVRVGECIMEGNCEISSEPDKGLCLHIKSCPPHPEEVFEKLLRCRKVLKGDNG
ncbi:MAG: hypothetical protein PHW02_00940 [bacterium]|nr:hypothetical protein [bacterium]